MMHVRHCSGGRSIEATGRRQTTLRTPDGSVGPVPVGIARGLTIDVPTASQATAELAPGQTVDRPVPSRACVTS